MSDLSSPTGQKNLCKTYSTFFGGGGRGRVRDVPTSVTLHSRVPPLFLDVLSPISLRRADVFPVVASLGRERSDDRKYVCASQAIAGYSPISPVSTAKYSVSI